MEVYTIMYSKELKKENYTVQADSEKKLLKFTTPSGESFEISGEEMSSMLVSVVNNKTLEATFVESERINVVEVLRQIKVKLDRDFKEGEEVRLNYKHLMPIEFALIEQIANRAKIDREVPCFILTEEYIKETKEKLRPEMEEFMNKFNENSKVLK